MVKLCYHPRIFDAWPQQLATHARIHCGMLRMVNCFFTIGSSHHQVHVLLVVQKQRQLILYNTTETPKIDISTFLLTLTCHHLTVLDLKNAFGEVHHNLISSILDYHHIQGHIKLIVESLF